MKETLEEAAKKYADTKEEYVLKWRIRKESIAHLGLYLGYIDGAKWQQEQLEKELNRFFLYLRNSGEHFIGVPNEQFVKKYLEGK